MALPLVLLTVPVAFGLSLAGIIMLFSESRRKTGKGLLTAGVSVGTIIPLCLAFVIGMLTGAKWWMLLVICAFILMVSATVICIIWGAFKKKSVWIPLTAAMLGCVLIMGGFLAYDVWKNSIPTVGESDNLLIQYRPYKDGTKVAVLDEPSGLTLDSDLPKMDGATALYPVYSAFARAVYPKEAIEKSWESECLDCSTTTKAYRNIVTGEADIIFVAAPSEEQKQFAADNGVELVYTPIGREAFVFFVNSQNPLKDISVEQIQGIYSGEITKWDQLGVDGLGKIRAFQRDEGSGSQSALERLMAGKNLVDPPKEDVVDGMGGIITRTADYRNFKNAIGYSFRFYSTEMVGNDQIRLLSINGAEPTLENIDNGSYPIASQFFAVTRSDADENTLRLLEWIQGEQGQKLVEATGYTPVK